MNKPPKNLPKRPKVVQDKTRFIRTSDFKPKFKPALEKEPSRWPVVSALIGIPLLLVFAIVGLLGLAGKQTYPEFVENEPDKNSAKKPVETKVVVTEPTTQFTDYGPPPARAPGSPETE